MKIVLPAAFTVIATCSVIAQGTFNASNNYVPPFSSTKAFVMDAYTPLSKALGRVEILNPADGAILSPGGSAGVPLTLDGLFFINGLVIPGVPTGGMANIIVRAWDSSTGATYHEAIARASALVFISDLGGGTTPAATFSANSNFRGLNVGIPEPSLIALASLGLVGLAVWCRRR